MKLAYFYYSPWSEAVAALPDTAALIYTGPDTGDYFGAFSDQWGGRDDLVCIEQDVLVHDRVVEQFAACPEPWCTFGWEVSPGQPSFWWLGCTKFSASLQNMIPVEDLRRPHPPEVCARCADVPCHRHLDVILTAVGKALGQDWPHVHSPDIRHLRAEPGASLDAASAAYRADRKGRAR